MYVHVEQRIQAWLIVCLFTVEDLRFRTHDDGRARQIYMSIPQRYHAVSANMAARHQKIYIKRRNIAHPPVTRTDFLSYLHACLVPGPRT